MLHHMYWKIYRVSDKGCVTVMSWSNVGATAYRITVAGCQLHLQVKSQKRSKWGCIPMQFIIIRNRLLTDFQRYILFATTSICLKGESCVLCSGRWLIHFFNLKQCFLMSPWQARWGWCFFIYIHTRSKTENRCILHIFFLNMQEIKKKTSCWRSLNGIYFVPLEKW